MTLPMQSILQIPKDPLSHDYVSPGFQVVTPDAAFPNMILGDRNLPRWPWFRGWVPHNWYVDRRNPEVGFASRDEASILYNNALLFRGMPCLEIGCWRGWSAVHIALEYGPKTSTLGFSAWRSSFDALWADICFPHLVILVIGAITLTAAFLCGVIREGVAPTAYQVIRSRLLPVTIFVFEAGLALTSSSNKGSGFFAPLIPGMMALSAWAFCRIGKSRLTKASFSSLVAIVAIVSALPLLDLRTPFAPKWTATLPLVGGGTITDGRGTIQKYEAHWGFSSHNTAEPLDKAQSNSWISLSRTTSDLLTKEFGMHATVMFGFRNVLYNVNTVNLMHLLTFHSAFAMNQVDPVMTGTSEQGYQKWLYANSAMACALLTKDQSKRDFLPVVDPKLMDEAAVQAGFVKISVLTTPDGQHVFLWKNKKSLPQCHPSASLPE